jgi:hypothetical protein
MYVDTDIITSILVNLSGQMYVETDIITSILVSLSGQMYVETDIGQIHKDTSDNVCLNIHLSWQTD